MPSRFVGWLLIGFAIGFSLVSIINFESQLSNQLSKVSPRDVNKLPYGVFDESLILALNTISERVPANETVIVSDHAPVFRYFTMRHTELPRGAYSEESLFNFMKMHNYEYLAVYEGASEVESLAPLFSSAGLYKLRNHYDEIGSYSTSYSKIHFYQIKN